MTDESPARSSRGSTRTPTVASLDDESIRRMRIVVMLFPGATAAIMCATIFLTGPDNSDAWEFACAYAYLFTALFCALSAALSRASLVPVSETLAIFTAYASTSSVIVTEDSDATFTVGVAACSLIVVLPGVAYRVRSASTGFINVGCVCVMYIASVSLRNVLRGDPPLDGVADTFTTLGMPPMAFFVLYSMVRAIHRRLLRALAESEHARSALRVSLDRQVALNDAMRKFVPREFLTTLGRDDISEVQLSDSVTKPMSILFADICGYTRLVEGIPPNETVRLLNDLFGALEPAVTRHHGFVDSYIGDAIMALFDGSPRDAIAAGLAMLTALERHNELRRAAGQPVIAIGIGIHTGVVTLGTTGGPRRIKCSVFGDAVNLAARIEHLTRRYEAALLVSAQTLELAGPDHGHAVRVVDRVRVVGRTGATDLVEVYDADPAAPRARKRRIAADFDAGVAAFYERRFADAAACFERCHTVHDDSVVRTYLHRSRTLRDHPPELGWTGVEDLHDK